VIAVLADQDLAEQAGAGTTALDRQHRRRRLVDRFAGPARHLRTDMLDDLEVAGDVFEHLNVGR
jgi:hypothetical protein